MQYTLFKWNKRTHGYGVLRGIQLVTAITLVVFAFSASASFEANKFMSLDHYKHSTPKFDYLHLDREADFSIQESRNSNYRSKNNYELFREGISAYFEDSYTEAINILLPLAKNGNMSAQFYVALMYDQGHGVLKNHRIAARWYRKAARQGHMDAQYNLGIAFASGQGVRPSIHKAIYWWRKAAVGGSVDAQYNLGMVYTTGRGVARNTQLAVKWWRKAAHNGDAAAQFNLGVVYVNGGKGVPKNICEATRLWTISAEQGFDRAKSALQVLQSMDRFKETGCVDVTARK